MNSEIFLLTLTLGLYGLGTWIYNKTRLSLLHPLITSGAALILFLYFSGIPYATYQEATRIIDFMLGPSVVALGYALYHQAAHLKANFISIFVSISVGSIVGVFSVVGIMKLFGSSPTLIASLAPKSVTTPIAMAVSTELGGIGSLTAVIVVLTGILGSVIAPSLFKLFGITSPVAQGLALGASSHGAGTGRAIEMGATEGAMAGLAMGLMGLITALLTPILSFFI